MAGGMKLDPESVAALEAALAERVARGEPGWVCLRYDVPAAEALAAGRRVRWRIESVEERVVASGVTTTISLTTE